MNYEWGAGNRQIEVFDDKIVNCVELKGCPCPN